MDQSDIARSPAASAAPSGRALEPRADDIARLHGLLAQIGAEIAGPLTAAIERINTLSSTGRIDPHSLRQLRDEVEAARQAGIIGQQLTRFASGRIRQSHERLQLAETVTHVLAHRQREMQARGVTIEPSLQQAEIICDASLLFSLLNSTIDWASANTVAHLQIGITVEPPANMARLTCCFEQRPADDITDGPGISTPRSLDSLNWRLLEQTAWAMSLRLDRTHTTDKSTLSIDFPTVDGGEAKDPDATEIDDGFASSANSRPFAGSHILVIASRREMRVLVRDALRHMSLLVDFVNSVEDAVGFCREGLPHAIIIEAIQSGERFAQFRKIIRAEMPDFVFIEIVEEGSACQMTGAGGSTVARVGRDALASSLPSALMFELSKSL